MCLHDVLEQEDQLVLQYGMCDCAVNHLSAPQLVAVVADCSKAVIMGQPVAAIEAFQVVLNCYTLCCLMCLVAYRCFSFQVRRR